MSSLRNPLKVSELSDASQKTRGRDIYCWACNVIPATISGTLTTNVSIVFNTALGLDAGLVGLANAIPRMVDALFDPLIGHMSDNTRSRWGRRRPYLFVGGILLAISLALPWWASPNWSQPLLFSWLLAGLVFFSFSSSIYSVPAEALGYELTEDYSQRTQVQTAKFLFGAILGLATPWIYWIALRPFLGGEIHGFRYIYFVLAMVSVAIGILPAFYCKERFTQANKIPRSFGTDIVQCFRNSYFREIIYLRLANAFGCTVFSVLVTYINIYYVCKGDKSLAMEIGGIGGTMYGLGSLAFIPFAPWVGERIGKRNGMILGFSLQFIISMLQPFILTPSYPYLQLVSVFIGIPAGLLANIFISSFMADVCDLGEFQTGQRCEGTYSAVFGFLFKIETTIALVLGGLMLDFAGFDQHAVTQTKQVLFNLLVLAYVPLLFFSAFSLFLACRFSIDRELIEKVQFELKHRS